MDLSFNTAINYEAANNVPFPESCDPSPPSSSSLNTVTTPIGTQEHSYVSPNINAFTQPPSSYGTIQDEHPLPDLSTFKTSKPMTTTASSPSNNSSPQSITIKDKENTHLPSGIKKRTLNTLAARRYRQRRVDQVAGLETVLKETEAERDALKNRVARLEGELDVLRRLMGTKV